MNKGLNFYPCPKCGEVGGVEVFYIEKSDSIELKIYKCDSCGKQSGMEVLNKTAIKKYGL